MKLFIFVPRDQLEETVQAVAYDIEEAVRLLFDHNQFVKTEWHVFSTVELELV